MDERGGFARSAEEIHAALADAEAGDKDREITALRAERDEMLSRLNKLYLHTAQPGSPPPGDLITGIGFNFTALRAENQRLREAGDAMFEVLTRAEHALETAESDFMEIQEVCQDIDMTQQDWACLTALAGEEARP